jgi:hypothetical protein
MDVRYERKAGTGTQRSEARIAVKDAPTQEKKRCSVWKYLFRCFRDNEEDIAQTPSESEHDNTCSEEAKERIKIWLNESMTRMDENDITNEIKDSPNQNTPIVHPTTNVKGTRTKQKPGQKKSETSNTTVANDNQNALVIRVIPFEVQIRQGVAYWNAQTQAAILGVTQQLNIWSPAWAQSRNTSNEVAVT